MELNNTINTTDLHSLEESLLTSTYEKLDSGIDTLVSICGIICITVCLIALALFIISIIRKKASSTLCKVSLQVTLYSALFAAMLYLLSVINDMAAMDLLSDGSPMDSLITYVCAVFVIIALLILGETINRSLLKVLEQKVTVQEDTENDKKEE